MTVLVWVGLVGIIALWVILIGAFGAFVVECWRCGRDVKRGQADS